MLNFKGGKKYNQQKRFLNRKQIRLGCKVSPSQHAIVGSLKLNMFQNPRGHYYPGRGEHLKIYVALGNN